MIRDRSPRDHEIGLEVSLDAWDGCRGYLTGGYLKGWDRCPLGYTREGSVPKCMGSVLQAVVFLTPDWIPFGQVSANFAFGRSR